MLIYNVYIKPESQVIDYLEKYSGLNYGNTGKGITLEQLHSDILEIIGIDTFIVGHGLENDLEVLNFYSENLIDTSYLFLSCEGHKIKLTFLVIPEMRLDSYEVTRLDKMGESGQSFSHFFIVKATMNGSHPDRHTRKSCSILRGSLAPIALDLGSFHTVENKDKTSPLRFLLTRCNHRRPE